MWSFFSRDPVKDFHYEILEKLSGLDDKSVWTVHRGKKKGTNEPVSVFAFDVKASSETQVQLAKGALKRIKTLRHPNILTFLDGVETEKVIYFATEPVVPLEVYLQENAVHGDQNKLAISWGLHQITKGLSFLINDCNLIHNNVCMASVFVDPAGEWKLAGVDYMYPAQGADNIPPVKILPALEKYDPPEKSDLHRGIRGHKWSSDMWGLGCLIWEVFNGPLPTTSSLKSLSKIPKSLIPNYCELVGANPKSRPNPAKFIEDCRQIKGFLNNSFVDTMLFLEEFQIKGQEEKTLFFTNLTDSLDLFPQAFCRHKILPQLLNAFEYGNAGPSVLAPLFKVGKMLEVEEYQKKIVPCVVKLFSSPDRATRVKLLQQIDSFIGYLQSNVVNDQIFPQVSQGFLDTNPVVREITIKAMLHLAEKLNYKNLNEELMKHFARLQAKDEQGGIRTNTTICLGKIAGYLNPSIRQKITISAFLRALKDPFPPARQAGILAIAATESYYLLKEVANRLLPALCSMTMDPEKMVRDQAFKAINGFITKLEKVSENPDLIEEMEKDVSAGGSAASSSASWAGWAVTGMSSLTSKIYKGKAKSPSDRSAPTPTQKTPSTPASVKQTAPEPSLPQKQEPEEDDGGWDEDDDWGELEDNPVSSAAVSTTTVGDDKAWGDDDDEEDWGSLEETSKSVHSTGDSRNTGMKLQKKSKDIKDAWGEDSWQQMGEPEFESTEDSGLEPASAYNWDDNSQDDFFSSAMGLPKKPSQKPSTKPSTKPSSEHSSRQSSREKSPRSFASSSSKSSSAAPSATSGGWDDSGWGDDGGDWGSVGSTSTGTTGHSSTKTGVRNTASSNIKQESKSSFDAGSGWDDTGGWDDSGLGSGSVTDDTAKKKKEEREQKRLQRQKELQQKREARKGAGALKLGAKKTSID